MTTRIFISLLVLGTLTSCSAHKHSINKLEGDGMTMIHTPSDMQTSYVKSKESYVRFCTETDVDFSKTKSSGFTLGASGESIGDESAQGALTLGGRDPAVLIARELMFRACEFILNVNADQRLGLKVYAGTLDSIIKITKYQQISGTQSVVADDKIDMQTPTPKTPNVDSDGGSEDSGKKSSASDSSAQSPGASKKNSDSFDWSYDWDYSDDDNSIDSNHP